MKYLSIIPIFILLAVVQIFIFRHPSSKDPSESATPTPIPENTKTTIVQTLSGVHVVENSSGSNKAAWELFATKGSLNKANDWDISDIKTKFYSDDGIIYNVTSNSGDIFNDKQKKYDVNKLELQGNVVTKASNGYTFYTDKAFYTKEEHLLTFPNSIKMVGPRREENNMVLTGDSMRLNLKNNQIKIFGHVFGKNQVTKIEDMTINSDECELNGKTYTASFFNHIKMQAKGFLVKSEKAIFHFDKKQITTAFLYENLEVINEDKKITADKLTIDFINKTYTFEGNSRVSSDNGDELAGDSIILENGGNRINVTNAKANFNPSSTVKPISIPNIGK